MRLCFVIPVLFGGTATLASPATAPVDQAQIEAIVRSLDRQMGIASTMADPRWKEAAISAESEKMAKMLPTVRALVQWKLESYLLPQDAAPSLMGAERVRDSVLWELYAHDRAAALELLDAAMERAHTAASVIDRYDGTTDLKTFVQFVTSEQYGLYYAVVGSRDRVLDLCAGDDRYRLDAREAVIGRNPIRVNRYLDSINRPAADAPTATRPAPDPAMLKRIAEVQARLGQPRPLVAADGPWLRERKDAVLAVARQEATRLMTLRGRKSGPGLPLQACLDALYLADPPAARVYELHQLKRAQLGLWIAERPWRADPKKTREMLGEEQTDLLAGLADVRAILLKRMMAQKDDQAAAIAKSAVRYDEDGVCLDYLLSLHPQPEGLASYLLDGLAEKWPGLQHQRARLLRALDLDENLRARTKQ